MKVKRQDMAPVSQQQVSLTENLDTGQEYATGGGKGHPQDVALLGVVNGGVSEQQLCLPLMVTSGAHRLV